MFLTLTNSPVFPLSSFGIIQEEISLLNPEIPRKALVSRLITELMLFESCNLKFDTLPWTWMDVFFPAFFATDHFASISGSLARSVSFSFPCNCGGGGIQVKECSLHIVGHIPGHSRDKPGSISISDSGKRSVPVSELISRNASSRPRSLLLKCLSLLQDNLARSTSLQIKEFTIILVHSVHNKTIGQSNSQKELSILPVAACLQKSSSLLSLGIAAACFLEWQRSGSLFVSDRAAAVFFQWQSSGSVFSVAKQRQLALVAEPHLVFSCRAGSFSGKDSATVQKQGSVISSGSASVQWRFIFSGAVFSFALVSFQSRFQFSVQKRVFQLSS
ncbi:hypothetical protein AKJ16_DCAP26466 [Drosera capensis]